MAKVKDRHNVVYFRYKLNDNTKNARMGIEEMGYPVVLKLSSAKKRH